MTTNRGRKALPKVEAATEPEIDTAQLAADRKAADSLAVIQIGYTEERDLLNQLIGQTQALSAIAKFADVVSLTKLAHIKENKIYRALTGKKGVDADGNEIADVGTWEGFCLMIGSSKSKVDEDILNLRALGEDAIRKLQSVGAGYRDLRKLRALPDEARTSLLDSPELQSALAEGDKDAIRELIEDMAVANRKKTDELAAEIESKDRTISDKGELIAHKDEEINDLKLKALVSRPWDQRAADINAESAALFTLVYQYIARLDVLQSGIMTSDFSSQADEEAVLQAVAVPFSDGLKRAAQMLVALSQRHDKTLGAFAEDLDAQPLGDLEERAGATAPAAATSIQ